MFGPFAGWSPKFLKHGHFSDLPRSVTLGNLATVLGAGLGQWELVSYLIGQLRVSKPTRMAALREFAPSAVDSDWSLTTSGQRVQVMHATDGGGAGWNSTPQCSRRRTAASPDCSVHHREPRPRSRQCSMCCTAASPTGTERGSPRARRWCRRWASPCPTSRRCTRSCVVDHQSAGAGGRTAMTRHFWLEDADPGGRTVFGLPCRINAQVYTSGHVCPHAR